ncbi:nitroreductase family protein [Micromonospora carbonacea]|uniref:nitroreductase family protein n=1 Tax=Micromonospora carbonacea TaxID=47853 RepID=UPI003D748722
MSAPAPFGPDEVERFTRRLRGTFDEVYPAGWSIDWAAIPSPFRWYPDLPRVTLAPLPHALGTGGPAEARALAAGSPTAWIGGYLQACYGLTGVRWHPWGIAKSSPEEPRAVHRDPHFQLRRPVPSGGVTFPAECYVLTGPSPHLPAGTYHYDATRHALAALPAPPAPPPAALRLVLTTPLWKNYYKYSDFSFRLGALDSGAVIGQFESVARRWGWSCRVTFSSDERDVLAHLGLDPADEAVVAVIDVDPHQPVPAVTAPVAFAAPTPRPARWTGAAKRPPRATGAARMNAACQARGGRTGPVHLPPLVLPDVLAGGRVRPLPVPRAEPVPVAASWARTALAEQLRPTPLPGADLARWLSHASAPLDSDLADSGAALAQVRCVLLARNVTGLPAGAHLVDHERRSLRALADGDFGPRVLHSMFGRYMNLAQAPAVVLLVGAASPHREAGDPLAYRVQHHVAGLMALRMVTAAAASGATGHPVLGFASGELDEPLGLRDAGWTALLMVAFGAYRRGLYLESSINPVAARAAGRTGQTEASEPVEAIR